MIDWHKRHAVLPKFILSLFLLCLGASSVAAIGSEPLTNTPIQHIVVVMQQNHTFDNYFGTYPNAAGFPSDTCIPISLSYAPKISCLAPFYIGTHQLVDLSHS